MVHTGGLPVLSRGPFSILEQCFKAFLRFQVEHSDLDLAVKYMPTFSATSPSQIFYSPTFRQSSSSSAAAAFNPDLSNCITVEITSPIFYTSFAYNPSPLQFFASSITPQSTEQQPQEIIHVSNPDLFIRLFTPSSSSSLPSSSPFPLNLNPLHHHPTWHLISFLRSLSLSFSVSNATTTSTSTPTPDTTGLSPLDIFIIQPSSSSLSLSSSSSSSPILPTDLKRSYRIALLKILLLANLGNNLGNNPFLIDTLLFIVRIMLCYVYARGLRDLVGLGVGAVGGLGGLGGLGGSQSPSPSPGQSQSPSFTSDDGELGHGSGLFLLGQWQQASPLSDSLSLSVQSLLALHVWWILGRYWI